MRSLVLPFAAAMTLGACSLIVDLTPLGAPDAASQDSSASDVLDANASDALDAGPSVNACGAVLSGTPVTIADPGFEQGCGGWTAYQSTLTDDFGAPLVGKVACRVCTTGGGAQIEQNVTSLTAQVGETYELVACVRDAPDAASLAAVNAAVTIGGNGNYSQPVTLTPTYQAVRSRWTTTASGTLIVSVQSPTFADAGCFRWGLTMNDLFARLILCATLSSSACDSTTTTGCPANASSADDIVTFGIGGSSATIAGTNITLTLPAGTNLTQLVPTIVTSPGATVSPASGATLDFSAPVQFTVVAADCKTSKVYTASVTDQTFLRTFYVSNDGDDSAAGTSPATAWKTIGHVNGVTTFQPGDGILFERGGTWRETLVVPASGSATNELTFGNYTGKHGSAKPKILGSIAATGWTETSSGSHVWHSSTTFVDPTTQPAIADIFFESAGSVTWGAYASTTSGLGAEYQWTWSSGNIYVYSPSDPTSRYTTVEVPQRSFGFDLHNNQYLHFDGIDVSYTRWSGYGYDNTKFSQIELFGLTIENVEVSYLGSYMAVNGITDSAIGDVGYGTELAYTNMIVRNDKIHDCGRRALSFHLYGDGFTAKNILIEGNEFFDGSHTTGPDFSVGTGYTASISDVVIRDNLLYELPGRSPNIHSELMFFQNRVSTATLDKISIYDNIFRYPNGYGILMEGVQGTISIFHNVFDDFNTIGIAHVSVQNNGQDSHAIFENNVSYAASAGKSGLDLYGGQSAANITAGHNVFFNTTSAIGLEAGSLTSDPLFVNAASYDFHLQPSSPAINAGIDVGVAVDRDGNPRVGAPDIGAYEFH